MKCSIAAIFIGLFLLTGSQYAANSVQTLDDYRVEISAKSMTALTGTTTQIFGPNTFWKISAAIDLPFTFTDLNKAYNKVKVSSNGFLTFDVSETFDHSTNNLAAIKPKNSVAPLWDYLKISASGQVHYQILGSAPNRVFVVEFFHVVWGPFSSPIVDFQILLFEGSNDIEFHYGTMADAGFGSDGASIGIKDDNGHFINALDGSRDVAQNDIKTQPATNFRFTTSPAPANDVGVKQILVDAQWFAGEPGTVQVVVENYGSEQQTGFTVAYQIEDQSPVREFFTAPLPVGTQELMTFNTPWQPENGGLYSVKAWTELEGDANAINDSTFSEDAIGVYELEFPVPTNLQAGFETDHIDLDWQPGIFQHPLPGEYNGTTNEGLDVHMIVNFNSTYVDSCEIYYKVSGEPFPFPKEARARCLITDNKFSFYISDQYGLMNTDVKGTFVPPDSCYGTWKGGVYVNNVYTVFSGTWVASAELDAPLFSNVQIYRDLTAGVQIIPSNLAGEITDPLTNSFTDAQIVLNNRYYYVVVAGYDRGNSLPSNEVSILAAPPIVNDVGVTALNLPDSLFVGNSAAVSVDIKNYGTAAQSNFPVKYDVNNGSVVTETFTGTIAAGETMPFTFAQRWQPAAEGTYQITAWTALAGDENAANDRFALPKQVIVRKKVNAPPVLAAIGNQNVEAGQVKTVILSATDKYGDVLTFAIPSNPGFLAVSDFSQEGNTATATLIISPAVNQIGDFNATIRVSDPEGLDDTEAIAIHVDPAQPNVAVKLYLDGSQENGVLTPEAPSTVTHEYKVWNTSQTVTFKDYFLTQDIVGTTYTANLVCATTAATPRNYSVTVKIGGQEVASGVFQVSGATYRFYTVTMNGLDPTISGRQEVELAVTLDGSGGATSGLKWGVGSRSTLELPPYYKPGKIAVVPAAVNESLDFEAFREMLLTINNIGLGNLNWAASVEGGSAFGLQWLTLSDPVSGQIAPGASSTLTVSLTGIKENTTLTGQILITSDDPTNSLVTIPVTMTVVRKNHPPQLTVIPEQSMPENSILSVSVAAVDPDGDALTLAAANLPEFGSFTDLGGGTGMFRFSPGFVEGTTSYADIRVIVTDNGTPQCSDTTAFTLTVEDVTAIDDPLADKIPDEYELQQNFPNPFNPTTAIRFGLPQPSQVTLEVCDITGKKVATLAEGQMNAGYHLIDFDGAQCASGVYFYILKTEHYTRMRKMMLVK